MTGKGNPAGPQILIVEDEALIALNLQHMLVGLGYGVRAVVASGKEALEKAGTADLVLMDVRLKGEMDGVEAAEEIRDRFGIPVIYLSALPDDTIVDAETFGYIGKPFTAEDLRSTIERALHKYEMEKRHSAAAGRDDTNDR